MNDLIRAVILCAKMQDLEEQIAHAEDKLDLRDKLINLFEQHKLDSTDLVRNWLEAHERCLDLKLKHNELEKEYLILIKNLEK